MCPEMKDCMDLLSEKINSLDITFNYENVRIYVSPNFHRFFCDCIGVHVSSKDFRLIGYDASVDNKLVGLNFYIRKLFNYKPVFRNYF